MSVGKAIGWAAGLVALGAFLVAPLLYGYRNANVAASVASGREFLDDASTSVRDAAGPLAQTPIAGNEVAALLVALVGIVLTVWLVAGARTGRALVVTSVLWCLLALALYLPGLAP